MTEKASKRLTLKIVAGQIGVSTATISNAFNRPNQLSAELRQKILEECERLGYHGPNPAARSLRTGSTGVVGVMLADTMAYNFKDPCAAEFLQGVSEVLDDAQVNILLMPGRKAFYKEKSLEAIPDRYIVYGPPQDLEILRRIEKQHKPVVTVDFRLPKHLSLNVDNYGGAKAAAKHLYSNIAGPIAVVGLRLTPSSESEELTGHELLSEDISISRQRLEAYKDAALESGRVWQPELIWSARESSWQEGKKAARELLGHTPRPKALLCMSDQLALGAMAAAREFEIRIPEDLAIVGFDDIDAAKQSHPALSTVYQPSQEKGRLAAMMVLNPHRHDSRVLPTKFIARASSKKGY